MIKKRKKIENKIIARAISDKDFQANAKETLQTQSPFNMMIDLIKYPVLNYKTVRLLEQNKQYVFDVDIRLTKPIIKKLFEDYFGVEIININTHIKPRKKRLYISLSSGYKNRYKRVIIKLKKDQSIPYIEQLMAGYLNQIVSRANAQSTNQENSSN